MKTLSACLIIKNEELVIERCLKSIIPICDEIIAVDTGSNDNTINIIDNLAEKCDKIKLYNFQWIHDFSAARNFSFSKATSDYIMWVDSDEMFTDKLNETILELKKEDFNNCDVIATSIQFFYNKNDYSFVNRERILLRKNEPYWRYRVHEELIRNTVKDDINEYIIPLVDGYVFHEKKKESNFYYYFQIYCDEINKDKVSYGHHNLYYLTWMCSFYDKIMAKLYAFDVFLHLPIYKYEIDYREWFKYNVLNENEYEMLKDISLLSSSFTKENWNDREINCNMLFIFNKCKNLYEKNNYFAAYYGLNFIIQNKMYFNEYNLYEEQIYEYFDIILWNINLISRFVEFTNDFITKYPNNKTAIQNFEFSKLINDKINKLILIINVRNNEWYLPHILYLTKSLFNKRIIITNKNISNIVDDSIIIVSDKNQIKNTNDEYCLYVNDDVVLDINFLGFLMKKFIFSNENNFEDNNKNYIFTKIKNFIENF